MGVACNGARATAGTTQRSATVPLGGSASRDAARLYHGSADSLVAGESARWLRSELRRGLGDAAAVELVEERGGTHNGMVFASLRRSLQAIARDVAAAAAGRPAP